MTTDLRMVSAEGTLGAGGVAPLIGKLVIPEG